MYQTHHTVSKQKADGLQNISTVPILLVNLMQSLRQLEDNFYKTYYGKERRNRQRSLNEVVINFHSICAQSAKESGAIKYGT